MLPLLWGWPSSATGCLPRGLWSLCCWILRSHLDKVLGTWLQVALLEQGAWTRSPAVPCNLCSLLFWCWASCFSLLTERYLGCVCCYIMGFSTSVKHSNCYNYNGFCRLEISSSITIVEPSIFLLSHFKEVNWFAILFSIPLTTKPLKLRKPPSLIPQCFLFAEVQTASEGF